MSRTSSGFRAETRHRLKRGLREKLSPEYFLKQFKDGDKVVIYQNSISQKGMPHPMFKGKVGSVVGRRGNAYVVEIYDGNKKKHIISTPEHLKLLRSGAKIQRKAETIKPKSRGAK